MIETERLILRPWRETDREAWLAMMADPKVADWLGGVLNPYEAREAFARTMMFVDQHGSGMWAAERKDDGALLGSIGVRRIPQSWDHPMSGEVEIGWRLARRAWGAGYATEGAFAALAWGFENLAAARIVAFTSQANVRSEAVMRRIGMTRHPDEDFDHPGLAAGHPLRRHIVYSTPKPV